MLFALMMMRHVRSLLCIRFNNAGHRLLAALQVVFKRACEFGLSFGFMTGRQGCRFRVAALIFHEFHFFLKVAA